MPHPENLVVETRKLTEYLLSPTSPRGRHKADFFQRFGYTIANMTEFAEALREHGQTQQVTRIIDSPTADDTMLRALSGALRGGTRRCAPSGSWSRAQKAPGCSAHSGRGGNPCSGSTTLSS